tara:strand:- start:501 stop:1340 length:840 start_codon:yes stop_codon:yes gene_type:complete
MKLPIKAIKYIVYGGEDRIKKKKLNNTFNFLTKSQIRKLTSLNDTQLSKLKLDEITPSELYKAKVIPKEMFQELNKAIQLSKKMKDLKLPFKNFDPSKDITEKEFKSLLNKWVKEPKKNKENIKKGVQALYNFTPALRKSLGTKQYNELIDLPYGPSSKLMRDYTYGDDGIEFLKVPKKLRSFKTETGRKKAVKETLKENKVVRKQSLQKIFDDIMEEAGNPDYIRNKRARAPDDESVYTINKKTGRKIPRDPYTKHSKGGLSTKHLTGSIHNSMKVKK